MIQKLHYLIRSLKNSNPTGICPDCGGDAQSVIDQKYFIQSLLQKGLGDNVARTK